MTARNELFDRLRRINPAQFEEVVFRLEIEPWIIPGAFAEPSVRAKAVIQRLEQEQDGLVRLERTLAERAISIIGEQYIGCEIEAQVKRIISEYTQQPFVGREEDKRRLDEFVGNNSRGVLLVTATAGFGKSALMVNWQQERQEDYFIAFHCFRSRYEKTCSVLEAYCHLLKQLYLYYNIRNGQFPNDENGMRDILIGMLREPVSQEGKRLVIVLDGLDEASKTFEPFFTLLPTGVFVIASARAEEGEKPEYLRNWTDNAQRLPLKRLSCEAIYRWLEQISELATYAQDNDFVKKLDETTGGFPLYLRFLIEDLRQAAAKNQDVRAVVRNSPGGFKAYVKEQFQLLAQVEVVKRQKKVQELFALLSVALGAISEDDIQELTSLNTWDWGALPWQATRWFSIQTNLYSFAHPLLADEFQGVLGRQAGSAQGKLIDYCARWQEHQSAYALRYYAEHLGKAKRWEELYKLAHNEAFVTAQHKELPNDPDLPLKTVQTALRGKAETDDARGMAEFLLVHARRLMQRATQESPLDALREGSLERAWKLAEQFEIERCILWYLLLAWVLATDATRDNGIKQSGETLERLQQKDLPRLSESGMKDCAVYWLTHLLATTKGTFTGLSKRILDNQNLADLCKNLAKGGNFAAALTTAQQIDYSYYRARALKEIAKAQAQAENFAAALTTAQQIDDSSNRAKALIEIAKAQVEAKFSEGALLTVEKILTNRNQHLPDIAAAFVETGDKKNFKQLLIPCAYYLDAAYQMCGHLAKLYPAQATAVAEVVSNINKVNE